MVFYVELSDKRNVYLTSYLEKKGMTVKEYVFGKSEILSGDKIVFSPAKKISIIEANSFPNLVTIHGGNISEEVMKILKEKDIDYKNMMQDELFVHKNAILTAEAVLSLAISSTDKSIFESSILILGFGRCGKAIATLFSKLNLNFAVSSSDEIHFAESHFLTTIQFFKSDFASHLGEFDIIINTIPFKVISDEMQEKISPNAVVLEISSSNCLDSSLVSGFKYISAQGLPGKFSPETAADVMLESILSH